MNFRDRRARDEPEINLIPMIDLLLVIIIFLMLTTTYSRFSELELTLPQAAATDSNPANHQIMVAIDREGRYAVGGKTVTAGKGTEALVAELQRAAAALTAGKDPVVVINADAQASHQSVVQVMEAARQAGLLHITFATQSGN